MTTTTLLFLVYVAVYVSLCLTINTAHAQVSMFDPTRCSPSEDFDACVYPPPGTSDDVACTVSFTDAMAVYNKRVSELSGYSIYLNRDVVIKRQVTAEAANLEFNLFGCNHTIKCQGEIKTSGDPRQTGLIIRGMGAGSVASIGTGGMMIRDLHMSLCSKGIWVILPTANTLTKLQNVHITLNANSTQDAGGAVYTDGRLSVYNSTFVDNVADSKGGALYSKNDMEVHSSTFVSNRALGQGGAIFSDEKMTVGDCSFLTNSAQLGGALYASKQSTIENCVFLNNHASYEEDLPADVHVGSGGAVFGYGEGDIAQCTFINNSASRYGGAMRFLGLLNVRSSHFIDNSVNAFTNDLDVLGGAIRVFWSVEIRNCSFIRNSVRDDGGAIFCENRVYTSQSTFVENSAGQAGGAVRARFVDTSDCTFHNNSARDGGAIFSTKKVTLNGSGFSENIAKTAGGAAFFGDGGTVYNCSFDGNSANTGAAINSLGETLEIGDCELTSNYCPRQGFVTSIVNHGQGLLKLYGTTIRNNSAFDLSLTNSVDLQMSRCQIVDNLGLGAGPHISASRSIIVLTTSMTNNNVSSGGLIGTSTRRASSMDGSMGTLVSDSSDWRDEFLKELEDEAELVMFANRERSDVEFIGCEFRNNNNNNSGCGVFNTDGSIFIGRSIFSRNSALRGEGGGGCGGVVNSEDSLFSENFARDGGGGFVALREAFVTTSVFECNHVDTVGAGFKLMGTKYIINDSKFQNNVGQYPMSDNCWDYEAGKGVVCIGRHLSDTTNSSSYSPYSVCEQCEYVKDLCQISSSPYSACKNDLTEAGGFACLCDIPEDSFDHDDVAYYSQPLTGKCVRCSECGVGSVIEPCMRDADVLCECPPGKTGNLCQEDCKVPDFCEKTIGNANTCTFSAVEYSLGILCEYCRSGYYLDEETGDCTPCTSCGSTGRVVKPCGRTTDSVCQCPLGVTGPGCEIPCQPPTGCALVDPSTLSQCVFDAIRYDLNVKCTSCTDSYYLATLPLDQHSNPEGDSPSESLSDIGEGANYTTCIKWRDCNTNGQMLYQQGNEFRDSACGNETQVLVRTRTTSSTSGVAFVNQLYLQLTQMPNTYNFIQFEQFLEDGKAALLTMPHQLANKLTKEADTYGPTLSRSMDIHSAQVIPNGTPIDYADDGQTTDSLSNSAIVGIVISAVILLLLILFGLGRWYVRRVAKRYETPSSEATERNIRRKHKWTDAGTDEARVALRQLREKNVEADGWICPKSFKTLDLIGTGAFGKIYRGVVFIEDTAVVCAVKCMKESDVVQMTAFQNEIKIQQSLDHPNLVHVLGASIGDEPDDDTGVRPLFLLMEFCEERDLWTYLNKNPESADVESKLWYAFELAKALSYLSDVSVIHRDVAARNCLLSASTSESFGHLNVKLSDMGMARTANMSGQYVKTVHGGLLPVRWMAIESIESDVYTPHSDVWSYGVAVWEIFSNGAVPFGFLPEATQVRQALRHGMRLQKPTEMPPHVYEVIQLCWHEEPEQRPDIHTIEENMRDLFFHKYYANHTMSKEDKVTQTGRGLLLRSRSVTFTSSDQSAGHLISNLTREGSGVYENVGDATWIDNDSQTSSSTPDLNIAPPGYKEIMTDRTGNVACGASSHSDDCENHGGTRIISGGCPDGFIASSNFSLSPYENEGEDNLDGPASDIPLYSTDTSYRMLSVVSGSNAVENKSSNSKKSGKKSRSPQLTYDQFHKRATQTHR
eukprot:CFRG3637T1